MKSPLIALLLIMFAPGLMASNSFKAAGNDTIIKEDSMNLAIIKLDFLTYNLEGVNISYYPLCDSCDLDSLPFIEEFTPPVDYGDIKFKYSYDMDVLFGGEIIWMGIGEIYQPDTFLPAAYFNYLQSTVTRPENAEYFDHCLIPYYWTEEEYVERADSAWKMIDSLAIVHDFAQAPFRVGFYAYTPTVGAFDPVTAKWLIFLYRGNDYPTYQSEAKAEDEVFMLFPNPCNGYLNIASDVKAYTVNVLNSRGSLMQSYQNGPANLDLSAYQKGLYFLQISCGENIFIRKFVIQ
jgi:Secretion system C-terminal sorting domain